MKDVTVIEEGGALVALLHCEIDHHSVKGVREAIDGRMEKSSARSVVLDFGGVGFMDSSGIGLILGRAEIAAKLGRTLRLRSLSPTLLRVIRLSGVERIKNIKIEAEGK